MTIRSTYLLAAAAAATMVAAPATAQRVHGDANSPVVQWGRMLAEPGTFWLDSNQDVEIIRYKTERDITLCLDRTDAQPDMARYPVTITWDNANTATLRAGNCYYFEAMTVKVKPAMDIPQGAVLKGRIMTS